MIVGAAQLQIPGTFHRDGALIKGARSVPEECAVAFSYAGTTHAVMMATPHDIEDFAVGFSLTEGIISAFDDIDDIAIVELETGLDVQIRLKDERHDALVSRRRHMAGPVGCGLCGIESIEQALRPVRPILDRGDAVSASDIVDSVRQLSENQPLNALTRAVHGAGFYVKDRGIVAVREDVGRHNALDKLAGALARQGIDGGNGIVAVTSRISVEMVQKTAIIGAPVLAAISAPTALAVRTAQEAGLTLAALVRGEEFDLYAHADRIVA